MQDRLSREEEADPLDLAVVHLGVSCHPLINPTTKKTLPSYGEDVICSHSLCSSDRGVEPVYRGPAHTCAQPIRS